LERVRANLLAVQRNLILGLLLGLAIAAWVLLAWQAASGDMAGAMGSLTMGMRAPLFLTIWVIMMVAMMFPASAPMILTFHRIQIAKRERGEAFVATWVFVTAYMLVWVLAGIAAYAGALAAEWFADGAAISASAAARIGGGTLIAAGLYQLTPLKDRCLSKCRTPLSFIMTSWRDGAIGVLRMGLSHGAYCLGCCWLLFVILFPLGIMNIGAMAAITALILAEKTLPWARVTAGVSATALLVYGALVLAFPHALPTFMVTGNPSMRPAPGAPMDMQAMPMPDRAAASTHR
jgi:predicted metal-binding membrane protein